MLGLLALGIIDAKYMKKKPTKILALTAPPPTDYIFGYVWKSPKFPHASLHSATKTLPV